MLHITIPPVVTEEWDTENEMFIYHEVAPAVRLRLEHSLVSLRKWESKWHKSFFSTVENSPEEILDYIQYMTLDKNVDPSVYDRITSEIQQSIVDYINNPMTATTFSDEKKNKRSKRRVTAELIYYWMFSYGIPIECEKWHLNQLLVLIRVFNAENAPGRKLSKREQAAQNAALNASRRKMWHTKG